MKLCECGCGKFTPVAKRTRIERGHIKGQPFKFIHGHNTRFQGTLQKRFEQYFEKTPDSCWIWKSSRDQNGYGTFNIDRKPKKSSRVSYELYKGPIPEGRFVCHKCDNPPCVNPDHLFIGTRKDNMRDMTNKGRSAHGEKNGQAKLTEQDVIAIWKDSRTHCEIGQHYGVTQSMITRIKNKKNWKHILKENALLAEIHQGLCALSERGKKP